MKTVDTHKQRPRHFYQKKVFLWPVGSIFAVVLVLLIAFRVSPWPGAMVIRTVFNNNGHKTLLAMQKYAPTSPVATIANQSYRPNDKDALLDVYFPSSVTRTNTRLPVIVWVHGGAWLSGDKSDDTPYFKLLAAKGYTVVAPNYSLAPEHTYPTPVYQLNDAYAYIQANASRFHADTTKFIFAGDSAGAQLSSQMAALVTNPAYAAQVGISPTVTPDQLRGVVLNCGIYNMNGLTEPDPILPKIVGWGNDVSVWSYIGTRDFSDPKIQQMSAYYHVTSQFPATYISGGNGDPLTQDQSMPFADRLETLGVNVTKLFFPKGHQPSLPHEYQFNLDTTDGQKALDATEAFITSRTQ